MLALNVRQRSRAGALACALTFMLLVAAPAAAQNNSGGTSGNSSSTTTTTRTTTSTSSAPSSGAQSVRTEVREVSRGTPPWIWVALLAVFAIVIIALVAVSRRRGDA